MGSRKRKIRRWIIGLVVGVLLLIVAAPYLAGMRPFRDMILRAALPPLDGTATARSASLGWFSPICFEGIEIRSPDGEPVVSIDRFQGDRPLWRLLFGAGDLGRFEIQRPRLAVVATEQGTNLREVFGTEEPPRIDTDKLPEVSVQVAVSDAGFSFLGRGATEPWSVEGINVVLGYRPSAASSSGGPELVVEPVRVFDRTPITPQMCDDLLKYIAPVLAEATDVSGQVSIELDAWCVPLADLHQGHGSGRMTIHTVQLGAGPLVRQLAEALGLPPSVRLVDHSVIDFEMAGGRVHHRGLKFGLPNLSVSTHGSVGLDQSLDLVAEITLAGQLTGDRSGPVIDFLQGKTLPVPIKGTLSRPRVDVAGLGRSGLELLRAAVGELLGGPSADGLKLLERLREQGLLEPGRWDTLLEDPARLRKLIEDRLGPDPLRDVPFLDRLRDRRQDRKSRKPGRN